MNQRQLQDIRENLRDRMTAYPSDDEVRIAFLLCEIDELKMKLGTQAAGEMDMASTERSELDYDLVERLEELAVAADEQTSKAHGDFHRVIVNELKRLQAIESAAGRALFEVGKVDGMTAGLLSSVGPGQPSEDWLKAFSGQREKMWAATERLQAALGGQALLGAKNASADANSQKIVVVIEGGIVQNVLAARGGYSVAVIDYDKNADLDDLIVIPQGDGKNAYALAAIHKPEVTHLERLDELYSAVVKADPAAEDEDCVRPRP